MLTNKINYKDLSDGELISLVKKQDRLAFTEIYDRYAITIYYKVNSILLDEDSSKDIVQDLFASIWARTDNLKSEENLAGYLFIASRNKVLKLIQKGKTRSDYLNELGKYWTLASYDTIDKLDEKELMMLVTEEIAKLPSKMQEVFQLSRVQNLSHKEIAQRLNISETTVRKQVQNSLRILRTRLSNYNTYGLIFLALFRNL
ncbi:MULTISPECIES: RNA polymerase sigma factor [Sphingobacterium]|uniref:RNA polymerase sigma factor n=1 Tax=Sphingobacterium TaxID=28453 RepID=UPI00257A82B5|nr:MULTISPECIES: RNA polymerase sigma-70 factor [Sphingobacterium]